MFANILMHYNDDRVQYATDGRAMHIATCYMQIFAVLFLRNDIGAIAGIKKKKMMLFVEHNLMVSTKFTFPMANIHGHVLYLGVQIPTNTQTIRIGLVLG